MNELSHPKHSISPYITVAILLAVYVVVFALYYDRAGIEVASLALLPVITASGYFGVRGGLLTVLLAFTANTLVLLANGYEFLLMWEQPGNLIGGFAVLMTAMLFGRLSTVSRERRQALIMLEQYEKERSLHAHFLEKLDRITALALEPDSLQTTLEIITEQLTCLFQADDGFFTLWDAAHEVPIPTAAFGSMRETFPSLRFEPGEVTLTASSMRAEHPLPVMDIHDTAYVSHRVAAIFPSRSMLAIPFITQRHKLGALLLGYREKHVFNADELFQAQITSEQVALLLSKLQLLEDERKQIRQLTVLHDVAITSTQVENEDQLIERVTEIIGKNLFPNNFGILLLDEKEQYLYPHLSYRFYKTEKQEFIRIQVGKGVTGQVARTGQSQRIGNVRDAEQYLGLDDATRSEICIPIRFKDSILGVINAESTRLDAFSEEDERLLVTLAGQIATSIEQLRREQAERKWLDQLAHSRDLIYAIAHIATQIDRSLGEEEIIRALGSELEGIHLTCIMAIYDSSLKTFTVNYTSLQPSSLEIVEAGLGYPLLQYIFPRSQIDAGPESEALLLPAIITDPEEEISAIFTRINRPGVQRILGKIGVTPATEIMRLPLVFEESLLGILWVWGEGIHRSDLPILSILSKQIGISLERARLFEEVQSLALTDPLTGVQNRRSAFELGRVEFTRARRMEHAFSCLMLDLDRFKRINDRFGHQVGDEVLREVAARCVTLVREGDLVGRYGGEELLILMPETDRGMAIRVAERLQAAIADQPIATHAGQVQVTVSIGVAAQDENTPHLEALIARADQALYIAKHKGRNQVAVSV